MAPDHGGAGPRGRRQDHDAGDGERETADAAAGAERVLRESGAERVPSHGGEATGGGGYRESSGGGARGDKEGRRQVLPVGGRLRGVAEETGEGGIDAGVRRERRERAIAGAGGGQLAQVWLRGG